MRAPEYPREYRKPPHQMDRIEHKLDLIIQQQGVLMADVSALNAAIEELDTDEVAAVRSSRPSQKRSPV